jgi:hypothetical protein
MLGLWLLCVIFEVEALRLHKMTATFGANECIVSEKHFLSELHS